MSMKKQTAEDSLLEQLPFWPHLADEERSLVYRRQTALFCAAGQHVRGGDMDCLGLILVKRGVLRAHLLSPDGKEITLYRIRAGEFCLLSASCVLDAVSFETHVDAEQDSEILLIPADAFAALLNGNIHVERDVYRLGMERFSEVVAGLERLVFFSLEKRIASFLLDEAANNASDTVQMTHEQIAVLIGSAREAVSRTLKGMAARGLVELFRGGVRLLDRPALYRMMGE